MLRGLNLLMSMSSKIAKGIDNSIECSADSVSKNSKAHTYLSPLFSHDFDGLLRHRLPLPHHQDNKLFLKIPITPVAQTYQVRPRNQNQSPMPKTLLLILSKLHTARSPNGWKVWNGFDQRPNSILHPGIYLCGLSVSS